MKLNTAFTGTLVSAALATLALSACGSSAGDQLDRDRVQAEMAGRWASPCDDAGLVWGAAGINSQRIIYNFYDDVGRSTELFSDDSCQTAVGEATYKGTSNVGSKNADGNNILDLNYLTVEVRIFDQGTVDLLNNPATPGCGINDWKVNEPRDVTSASGSVTCPIAKPAQVFDIVKTDGQSLQFGLVKDGLDKSTQDKRPKEIDTSFTYTKQ
ncbi:MAG: hypothetical protein V4692_02275 [Bdellovibrionota bacterium]